MGQDRLPCLPISVLDSLIRDRSHGTGHHEICLVEETDSPRAPDPAFPLSRYEARLTARQHPRSSHCLFVSIVRSLHRDVPPLVSMSHHPKFFVRHGHSLNQFASLIYFASSLCPLNMLRFPLAYLDIYTEGLVSSFGWVVASLFQLRELKSECPGIAGVMEPPMS